MGQVRRGGEEGQERSREEGQVRRGEGQLRRGEEGR